MAYQNIPEEELKNKVAQDYFAGYDCTKIIGKVDFCVLPSAPKGELFPAQALLWAEAKANKHDIIAMFAQLILTIGRARTFNRHLPPAFLGAFDAEKIAFVPYGRIQHLFYQNDFNWNVAPSDHSTKEFAEIKSLIDGILASEKYLYHFGEDDKDLRFFIRNSLARGTGQKVQIDRNNFVPIYLRWLDEVKPLINFDFESGKKQQIFDSDFYLADLFVDDKGTTTVADDVSIKEDLFVVFRSGNYEIARENIRQLYDAAIRIKNKTAYENFWKRYKRPPLADYHNYILERRDLLVPQDVRERKGAFFTPKQWVELSQKYIADALGENWQEEYYVWDCAAGTGNLLAGLTNRYNIWASTLDQADVNVMRERINNGATLLESHVFQFDFLNDGFDKLPQGLQDIIRDPEKRKKLVVYINPPYAEAGNRRTFAGTGENKTKTATDNRAYDRYKTEIGKAGNELFTLFLYRVYREIPNCTIANFSKLKSLQSLNFEDFRKKFQAKLEKLFLIPAHTFYNVTGRFPIGFFIWNAAKRSVFAKIVADVYDENGRPLVSKTIYGHGYDRRINQWIGQYKLDNQDNIGFLAPGRNDFQHINHVYLANSGNNTDEAIGRISRKAHVNCTPINTHSIVPVCVYLAVHHSVEATWLNDRDQFLYPNDSWEKDVGFHNDCLVFTLFHGQNRITAKEGANHWIPFTESEGNARDKFASDFMSRFIAGKIKKTNGNGDLFSPKTETNGTKCRFSPEAQAVFDAGRELWRYYHAQQGADPNAALYDIREHFQGRNEKTGRMNNSSPDEKYNELIGILRGKLNVLAEKIAEKVYEHGFLRI